MLVDIAGAAARRTEYRDMGEVREVLYLYTGHQAFAVKIEKLFEERGKNKKFLEMVQEEETEFSYIHVNYGEKRVTAFRSITSHYELFYTAFLEGEQILSDHMNQILKYLPVEKREPSIEAVCDTTLYQHNYGRDTYLKNVYRLGGGEELVFTPGKRELCLVQKIKLGKYDFGGEAGDRVLERSLRDAWEKLYRKDALNTLSGGVDSTITHIIMGNPRSVSASYEYEKFLCEKEYALEAAKLMGAEHTVYDIAMPEYMGKVRKATRAYGMPVYNLAVQAMHTTIAEHVKDSHMFLSELAGAVYGLELRTPYTPEAAARHPVTHPLNYASINSMIAAEPDLRYIEKIFGEDMVVGRIAKRNEYVLDRLEGFDTEDTSKNNMLQLGHLIDYFSNNCAGVLEQTEMAERNTFSALFLVRKVLESFLSLPLEHRYENEEYGEKPYAKILLKRLLPSYEVNKPKLGGSLPRTWMVTEGPMGGYFMEHEIPDFVPDALHEDMRKPSWESSWGVKYMIMYSIWREEVLGSEIEGLESVYVEKL